MPLLPDLTKRIALVTGASRGIVLPRVMTLRPWLADTIVAGRAESV